MTKINRDIDEIYKTSKTKKEIQEIVYSIIQTNSLKIKKFM